VCNPGEAVQATGRAVTRRVRGLVLLALAFVGGAVQAQQSGLSVQLGSPSITLEESVRFVVVATDLDGELDVSALDREFDVIGGSSSVDVRVINGVRSRTVIWLFELLPRATGVFTVPAVTVGEVESELLTLTVTEPPTGAERDVFIEASVDTSEPWVQSQVMLTLTTFSAVQLISGKPTEPAGEGVDVYALGESPPREELRDGRRYRVDERRFALIPQRSGALEIEPITLTATVPVDSARTLARLPPTKKLLLRTAPVSLSVKARPADSDGWWLPASEVVLEESWAGEAAVPTPADGEVRVGEPLTRTVTLRATGVLDTQLPEITAPDIDGLAAYADDPVGENRGGADRIVATRTVSFALIPERPGTFELPPVTVDWFDVDAGRARTASLPARTLTVLPGAGRSDVAVSSPADTSAATGSTSALVPGSDRSLPDGPVGEPLPDGATPERALVPSAGMTGVDAAGIARRWRLLAIVAIVGWILTAVGAVYAWQARRHTEVANAALAIDRAVPPRPDVRAARRAVEAAAAAGNAEALARAVLQRAAAHWPDDPPRNLSTVARRLTRDAAVAGRLRSLDATLYGRRDARAAGFDAGSSAGHEAFPSRLEAALDAARAGAVDARTGRSTARGSQGAKGLPTL